MIAWRLHRRARGAGAAIVTIAALGACTAEPPPLAALLPHAEGRLLRAALLLDSRDCLAHIALLDLLARPGIAAVVPTVAVVTTDGARGVARATDALLTYGLHVPVVAGHPALSTPRDAALARAPMLMVLAPDGRIVFSTPAPASAHEQSTLAAALARVADHYAESLRSAGR